MILFFIRNASKAHGSVTAFKNVANMYENTTHHGFLISEVVLKTEKKHFTALFP